MKKILYFMLIFLFMLLVTIFFYLKSLSQETPKNNSSAVKLSSNTSSIDKITSIEKEIASFSTEIKDNSEGRLTNIRLTCSILNNTTLKPGEIFSFNDIVGQPSSERGYQEATIIIDGEHETGIGGGNCQVSSTLYNAVLAVPTLTVIERNEHGLPVAYVPEGQDAAVSYGSLDLQFRNDSNKDIIIEMITDDKNITAKIYEN